MGRTRQKLKALDVEVVQQTLVLRQGGVIVRRGCRIDALTGEPAAFSGPGGKLMVRVYVGGSIRRMLATQIAWCLATGQWPDGPVLPRNGDPNDLRFENLIQVRHGRDPFGMLSTKHRNGGRSSSLVHRTNAATTLIRTLAEHSGVTIPQLSRLVGSPVSCTCTKLGKLADAGF
jgi:hypothetical protein